MKIKLSQILPIFILIFFSCKKENSNDKISKNIAYLEVNRTLDIFTYKYDTLNLDDIGTFDISFYVTTIGGQLAASVAMYDVMSGIVEDTIYGSSYNYATYAKALDKDVTIQRLDRYTATSIPSFLYNGYVSFNRNATKSDKYYGFKVKLTDGIHYGWMLINIDKDALKVKIKEIAYNKEINASIKAGEK